MSMSSRVTVAVVAIAVVVAGCDKYGASEYDVRPVEQISITDERIGECTFAHYSALTSLDPDTGQILWEQRLPDQASARLLTFEDGTILAAYQGSSRQHPGLVALRRDGTPRWQADLTGGGSITKIDEERVLVVDRHSDTGRSQVRVVDIAAGRAIWTIEDQDVASVTFGDGVVAVAGGYEDAGFFVTGYELSSGTELWQQPIDRPRSFYDAEPGSPLVFEHDLTVMGMSAAGDVRWTASGMILATTADAVVIDGWRDDRVYKLDRKSGQLMWEVAMTALVYSYDEHLGIGRIYVEPEALYFDATTGEPLSGSDGQWRLAEWNEEAQVWSDSESDGTTHYSLRSGSETRWEATIEPRQRHLAMTPTDVFVSIDDGAYWGSTWSELISIDIATGEERWSSYLEGGIVDGLVVLDDQVLVSVNEHPELCH